MTWTPIGYEIVSASNSGDTAIADATALQAQFNEFNDRYFGSQLPAYRVITPYALRNRQGRCFRRQRLIAINPECRAAVEALLHEMVHASVGYGHGFCFHRETERILSMGAPITPHLDYKPAWINKLPLCHKWAEERGLRSFRAQRAWAIYCEIGVAVADLGQRTLEDAINQAAYSLGCQPETLLTYCSMKRMQTAFNEGMAVVAP